MKTITPYLLRFALTAALLSITFRYFLSFGIENQSTITVVSSSAIYGILMFIFGWYFGKKDGDYLPIFDVGFRFHFTTYLIHNTVSLLWIGFGLGAKQEELSTPVFTAIYWVFFLMLHFIFFMRARKNTIDDLDKKDIFD